MCHHCDYFQMLESSGLAFTQNRFRVLSAIGTSPSPLSAKEIHGKLGGRDGINRVTVYRILDLLVDAGLVDRLSGGGRRFFYGLAPNEFHEAHPHFYCTSCGAMRCLEPGSVFFKTKALAGTFSGRIEKVEIRVDGVCSACLNND